MDERPIECPCRFADAVARHRLRSGVDARNEWRRDRQRDARSAGQRGADRPVSRKVEERIRDADCPAVSRAKVCAGRRTLPPV